MHVQVDKAALAGTAGRQVVEADRVLMAELVERAFDLREHLGLVLSVASSVLNGVLAWSMLRTARAHRSVALEGDARHLFTDVWTSAGVVLGLLAVAATGWLWLDPVIALAVAANILREGAGLVRRAASGLLDAGPQRSGALRTSVEQALMAAVPGLRATIQLLPMDVEAHFDDKRENPL